MKLNRLEFAVVNNPTSEYRHGTGWAHGQSSAVRFAVEPRRRTVLNLILTYSDHLVAAMFLLIAVALLAARPRVSCCRRPRWERHSPGNRRRR